MGLADEFERRLERVVEGFFSKTFRSHVQPAEIGRRLVREMEASKTVSVGAVYVANRYVVRLSSEDLERLDGLGPTLDREFGDLLRKTARERRWKLPGAPAVEFVGDESLSLGRFEIDVLHDSTGPAPGDNEALPEVTVVSEGARRKVVLEGTSLVVGRLATSDIVVTDQNVSRRHAELVRRDDGWWVLDLESTNGTMVNGTLIKERRLDPGDVIHIGDAQIRFGAGEDPDA